MDELEDGLRAPKANAAPVEPIRPAQVGAFAWLPSHSSVRIPASSAVFDFRPGYPPYVAGEVMGCCPQAQQNGHNLWDLDNMLTS